MSRKDNKRTRSDCSTCGKAASVIHKRDGRLICEYCGLVLNYKTDEEFYSEPSELSQMLA